MSFPILFKKPSLPFFTRYDISLFYVTSWAPVPRRGTPEFQVTGMIEWGKNQPPPPPPPRHTHQKKRHGNEVEPKKSLDQTP